MTGIDYMFMRAEGDGPEFSEAKELVAVDRDTGYPYVIVVDSKADTDSHAVRGVTTFVENLHHNTMVLRSDGEPALTLIKKRIQNLTRR